MKGLELSRLYFEKYGRAMIDEYFPSHKESIAAGLVGMGSECFGFDDEISRDHDWGPGFCIWLEKSVYAEIGKELQEKMSELPQSCSGFERGKESAWGGGRLGVFEIVSFYKQFIGFDHVPAGLNDWRTIPEVNLSVATNGDVFTDPAGTFSKIRNELKKFYPEDIRLKKIAHRCMTAAQAGQYNFMRCVRREEFVAAQCAETEFITAAISLVFLLNKRYRPFYKWMHRALKNLPVLGNEIHSLCARLATARTEKQAGNIYDYKNSLIEEICRLIINELWDQGLTDSTSDFLLDHGPVIQKQIKDPFIRSISVWKE